MAQTKLTKSALSIAGDKASAGRLGPQMNLAGTIVAKIVLLDTGKWLTEGRPRAVMDTLTNFRKTGKRYNHD